MGLKQQAIELAQDLLGFGPWATLRHRTQLLGHDTVPLHVPDVGPIYVRPGHTDYATLRQTFRNREYSFPTAVVERTEARYEQIVASGLTPVIVDAGANIGVATIWFKKLFPKAHLVAIEPDPANAAILRRNVATIDGATVLEAAIGSRGGFVQVIRKDTSWGVQTQRSDEGVRVVTVNDAVAGVPGGVPFIVKVDIEGFEGDLFSEGVEWLDEAFVVIIEPHDWLLPGKRTSRSFQRAFGARDFDIFLRGENLIYVRP